MQSESSQVCGQMCRVVMRWGITPTPVAGGGVGTNWDLTSNMQLQDGAPCCDESVGLVVVVCLKMSLEALS